MGDVIVSYSEKVEFLRQRLEERIEGGGDDLVEVAVLKTCLHMIEFHSKEFILLTSPWDVEKSYLNDDSVLFKIQTNYELTTREEYIKMFGNEPQMTQYFKDLLIAFRGHPNFKNEWLQIDREMG